jgi:hypothetical protein
MGARHRCVEQGPHQSTRTRKLLIIQEDGRRGANALDNPRPARAVTDGFESTGAVHRNPRLRRQAAMLSSGGNFTAAARYTALLRRRPATKAIATTCLHHSTFDIAAVFSHASGAGPRRQCKPDRSARPSHDRDLNGAPACVASARCRSKPGSVASCEQTARLCEDHPRDGERDSHRSGRRAVARADGESERLRYADGSRRGRARRLMDRPRTSGARAYTTCLISLIRFFVRSASLRSYVSARSRLESGCCSAPKNRARGNR